MESMVSGVWLVYLSSTVAPSTMFSFLNHSLLFFSFSLSSLVHFLRSAPVESPKSQAQEMNPLRQDNGKGATGV